MGQGKEGDRRAVTTRADVLLWNHQAVSDMGMFLEECGPEFRPRILRIQLNRPTGPAGEVSSSAEVWQHADRDLDSLGTLSGSALALCLFLGAKRSAAELPCLVIAVGAAVRAGLPTASRATVAGISPLTGTYVDSQVGGGLGRRLAQICDALVLEGQCLAMKGAVLVINLAGSARLEAIPALGGLAIPERAKHLKSLFPQSSGLCVGSAGSAGVAFASLATLGDPPSYSGRGGLGAQLGFAGLVALVVEGPEPEAPAKDPAWAAKLDESAHLRARGSGGTFELLDAFAARGDLRADPELRSGFANTLARREACPGCPTACRHVVALGERRLLGRFSATHPLGQRLGLDSSEDQLLLLEACNAIGVDAGETGAVLELLQKQRELAGQPTAFGDVQALVIDVQALLRGTPQVHAQTQGALAFATSLGLEFKTPTSRGSAVRAVSDCASLLGQCVSVRGNDPMRVFPFLAENGGDRERLAELFAPIELPAQTFDPKVSLGKGRLVWWHENLANVVDASGFCAFSAAGLLGDGLGNLDDLAQWLALPGLVPSAEALLAAGASLVLLQRELAERLGEAAGADLPPWAQASLREPGMWDEYRQLRGLTDAGRVAAQARATIGTVGILSFGLRGLAPVNCERVAPSPAQERTPGQVHLAASGALAKALSGGAAFATRLPLSLGSLLREIATERPASAEWLWGASGAVVSVYRDTERLQPDTLVQDGDRLDLVLAISGG